MFDIIYREVSNRDPKAGERWYCQDWACPAKWECRHHHGRSFDYNAMVEVKNGSPPLLVPDRPPFSVSCQHFERDRARAWLHRFCCPDGGKTDCPGCNMPECPIAPSNVIPFPQGAA